MHNIIVGKLWIDQVGSALAARVRRAPEDLCESVLTAVCLWSLLPQSGEIDVVNHTTGDRCHLKFAPYSYFSRDVARKVSELFSF